MLLLINFLNLYKILEIMALYLVGLGLWDEKDITLKGLEAVKNSDKVYLETYTSKLACSIEDMESLYGKKVHKADREIVENKGEEILEEARQGNVSLLVIGDPFCATTHNDLKTRAQEMGIEVRIIHNASIINAVGITGLDLYKFGKITSVPFANENITSPLDVVRLNQDAGLSTLVLLDLDPVNNKYMSVDEALEFFERAGLGEDTFCVGCAGIGSGEPQIKAGELSLLKKEEFTLFPQCLIIPGKMHFMEEESLKKFTIASSS